MIQYFAETDCWMLTNQRAFYLSRYKRQTSFYEPWSRPVLQLPATSLHIFILYSYKIHNVYICILYSWHKSWAKNVEYIQTQSANDTTGNCSSFHFLLPPYQSQWIEPLAFSDKPASSKAAWHLYHCEVGTQGPKISVGKKHFMKFMPWVAVQLLFMLWPDYLSLC